MSLQALRKAISEFFNEEDATVAVEYAVMLTLIVVVCLTSITAVATSTGDSFNTTESAIDGAFGN
jgi:pilus assembly protein Flp/PilA